MRTILLKESFSRNEKALEVYREDGNVSMSVNNFTAEEILYIIIILIEENLKRSKADPEKYLKSLTEIIKQDLNNKNLLGNLPVN